jgi:hypothetical protein
MQSEAQAMRTQLQRLAALRPTHPPTTNLERTETAAETAPQTSGKRTMKKINKPYRDSIAAIKAAGFSHFKVELEATFNRGNFWETWAHPDYCQRYIMRHLSAETKAAIGFKHFYNDGTVDSELTFTLPIDEAHRAIEVMQVFMSIGQKTGHTNTDRAGMHLTVMTSSVYPTRKRLSAPELRNFTTQINKLMPALFMAASHSGTTRGLRFRMPKVSHHDKYSAIYTHGGTCLEYRVFDPCYDEPEALLEKIQVIAATLKYFSAKTVSLKHKSFELCIGSDSHASYQLKDSLTSLDNLRAFNETLRLLKPAGIGERRFKAERGLKVDLAAIYKQAREQLDKYRFYYKAYLKERDAYYWRGFADWTRRNAINVSQNDMKALRTRYETYVTWQAPKTLAEWVRSEYGHDQGYRISLNGDS